MKIFYTMDNQGSVNILDYKELNLEDIHFSHPKKVKGGSYISEAYFKNSNKENLKIYIQSPKLVNTTGIVKNDSRCYIELELDQSHYPFFKFITDLDDHNIVNIQKNSLTWFNKHFPIDVVEEFYKTPIKVGKNKTPPKLRLKIPVAKNSIVCNIYDESKNVIDFTNVKKSSKVICVLEFIGLRFLKQQVLCEWNPVQIKLCDTVKSKPQKYLINEDLLTDDEEIVENFDMKITDPVESVKETVSMDLSKETETTQDTNSVDQPVEEILVNTETTSSEPSTNNEVNEERVNTETNNLTSQSSEVEESNNSNVQNTEVEVVDQPNSGIDLVIEELPDDDFSLEDIDNEEIEKREAIEDLIVNEIKNEIDDFNLTKETNENENNSQYNDLLNAQDLLKKTQEELELFKKMSSEKDQKILELKSQFRQFVQNLD